jgi:serine/threonine-protein phosphatase 5
VFSAPDYPQFQDAEEAERYKNKAAVAVLEAPEYAAPTFLQFEAVLPRPKVGSAMLCFIAKLHA